MWREANTFSERTSKKSKKVLIFKVPKREGPEAPFQRKTKRISLRAGKKTLQRARKG